MINSDMKRILDMLVDEARNPDVGIDVVNRACKGFLAMKLSTTSDATPRLAVPPGWVRALWQRQNGICLRCNNPQPMRVDEATFDHIVPLAEGGEHSKSNGRVIHGACNSSKGARNVFAESKRTGQPITDMFPTGDTE